MASRTKLNDPVMSDTLLLVSVEELINLAMGPKSENVVNFKLIEQILHILARQLRLLEQRVEIRITERVQKESSRCSSSPSPPPGSPEGSKVEKDSKIDAKADKGDKDKGATIKGQDDKDSKKDAKADKSDKDKGAKPKGQEKIDSKIDAKADEVDKDKGAKSKGQEDKDSKKDAKADKGDKDKGATIKGQDDKDSKKDAKADKSDKDKGAKPKGQEKIDSKIDAKADEVDKDKGAKSKGQEDKDSKKDAKADKSDKGDKIKDKEKRKAGDEEKPTNMYNKDDIKKIDKKDDKGKKDVQISLVAKTSSLISSLTKTPSIEVVTLSQFALLEQTVNQLKSIAGPLPPLALPDNETLRADLVTGRASLTDTMQAMQVNARVQAAEEAISRMTGLLTQLASSGALAKEVTSQLTVLPEHSKFDPKDTKSIGAGMTGKDGGLYATSKTSPQVSDSVTREEMEDALCKMAENLNKTISSLTTKAASTADSANLTAKNLADKMEEVLKLDSRIANTTSVISDYTEQLAGFDEGFATQIRGISEQMVDMRIELKAGLALLEQVNNNAETTAVKELNEHYEGLVSDMDQMILAHQALTSFQFKLGDELNKLIDCVEMLREEKSDRDEVLDALKDKADKSRLNGFLTELQFDEARRQLEQSLDVCHDKFNKQENVWMRAINDMQDVIETKADMLHLLKTRGEVEEELQKLNDWANKLAEILGDPKAAVITRQLGKDAVCGSCQTPALMDFQDKTYGMPLALPALRPPPVGAEEPCEMELIPLPSDDRHLCARWCGGSHTLLSSTITKVEAKPLDHNGVPTKKYLGYGDDGRLYKLEEEIKPCLECNIILASQNEAMAESKLGGAGDQGLETEAGK